MKKTILLVEDEADIASILSDVLDLHGHQVVVASDGYEGLKKARVYVPDLVVTDVMMPSMGGAELIERVRQIPGLERVPVIAISAAPYHCQEPFLRKPFDVHELVALVRRTLEGCGP